MSEWKLYSGSDEQIAEIRNCETDILCRYQNGIEKLKSSMFIGDWKHKYLTHYLICDPHPLRDMIKRQADTGQEVYIRVTKEDLWLQYDYVGNRTYKTTTPDWNIPNAEYSFTPFEGIKND